MRLPLAAAFLATTDTLARVIIIVLAAASDYLDGWWARTRGPRTRTGALLDPITDRVFVIVALLTFVVHGVLATWQLLVLLARDIFVALGFAAVKLLRIDAPLEARYPGKVVTTLQLAAVLVFTLLPAFVPPLRPAHATLVTNAIVALAAAAGAWAILDYGRVGVLALRMPRARR